MPPQGDRGDRGSRGPPGSSGAAGPPGAKVGEMVAALKHNLVFALGMWRLMSRSLC